MKTFQQFIREHFFKGAKGNYGEYVEIYKNPSHSEIQEIRRTGGNQLAAWIVDKDLYVWNRDAAEHRDVRHEIPAGRIRIPLYLYPATDKSVRVSISSFSVEGDYAFMSNAQITEIVKTHPAFKIFSTIEPY